MPLNFHMSFNIIADTSRTLQVYVPQISAVWGNSAALVLLASFLAWCDATRWVTIPWTICACFSVHCGHVFLYLLNQRMAIYHREGQLRIFYLARSVPGPNSAFLWKTAVILIDEIQRCPKQSGGSPTVAHRRGAPVLSLFPRKKGARPENTRGKNHDSQFKRGRKAAFLYRQWESGGNLFH